MTQKTVILLDDLIIRTEKILGEAKKLRSLPIKSLTVRTYTESWSALECLEHLNLYGDFYLPEIEQRMLNFKGNSSSDFKTGVLGNYFAKMMLPKERLNKMKTLADKNPINSHLDVNCLEKFISQQQKMLELLELAKSRNLTKIKTSISISRWIKLRLGDTFRVVIYHNQRHMLQAQNVLNQLGFKS